MTEYCIVLDLTELLFREAQFVTQQTVPLTFPYLCSSPSTCMNPTSEQGNQLHLDLLASIEPATPKMIAHRELRSAA
jgi:hypothetical protein